MKLVDLLDGKKLPFKVRNVDWASNWWLNVTRVEDGVAMGADNLNMSTSYLLQTDGFEPYVAAVAAEKPRNRTVLKQASYDYGCRTLIGIPSADFEAGVSWLMRRLKAEAKRRQRLSPDVASFLANVSAGLKKVR